MEFKINIEKHENIDIKIFREFNTELKNKWEKIEEDNNIYIFQRYSWNNYWFKTFNTLYDFYIFVIQTNEVPIGIFPFCINRNGLIKTLSFIGGDQSDYLTPIIIDSYDLSKNVWYEILKKLNGKYDIILLEKIPESIKAKNNSFVNLIHATFSAQSFGIKLPESYLKFDFSLKRSFRNDNKRNLKRLNELGSIEFRKIIVTPNKHEEFDKYIGITIEQKSRRIKNYLGKDLLENKQTQDFYKKSYLLNDSHFNLDYTILTLNNKTVLATHWGFYDNDWYYFIFPTMEGKEWYKYSCGKLVIDFLIDFSISENHLYFDFTVGDENYKKDWCNNQMNLYSFSKAKSLKGFLYLYFKNSLRRFKMNKFTKSVWRYAKPFLVNKRKRK